MSSCFRGLPRPAARRAGRDTRTVACPGVRGRERRSRRRPDTEMGPDRHPGVAFRDSSRSDEVPRTEGALPAVRRKPDCRHRRKHAGVSERRRRVASKHRLDQGLCARRTRRSTSGTGRQDRQEEHARQRQHLVRDWLPRPGIPANPVEALRGRGGAGHRLSPARAARFRRVAWFGRRSYHVQRRRYGGCAEDAPRRAR